MARSLHVTEPLRRKAASEGDECRKWLDDLPALVETIEREWSIAVGATFAGGTAAFVAEAVTADGSPAVLKLVMPAAIDGRDALPHEVRTLELAGGDGCARLLRHDLTRGALLLERLGRRLADLAFPLARQLEIIAGCVEQLWSVAPTDDLPGGDAKGRWLIGTITAMWHELGRPCSARVIEHAVDMAGRRVAAFDRGRAVLVHGDAHAWNTLEADSTGEFKLVDPDGLAADPEYDLAIPMRELCAEDLGDDRVEGGRRWAGLLAELTGRDARAIWEWSVVERVSTGLLLVKEKNPDLGRKFLAIAEQWAGG